MIIRRLCVLLDAETVYRKLSTILKEESDLDFASIMVQVLSICALHSIFSPHVTCIFHIISSNPTF